MRESKQMTDLGNERIGPRLASCTEIGNGYVNPRLASSETSRVKIDRN